MKLVEDAFERLLNICRPLAPGGRYICITPRGLNGPHDISKLFDRSAGGFHLRECSVCELSDLFRETGFSHVQSYVALKRRFLAMPETCLRLFEALLDSLPYSLRKAIGTHVPGRLLLDIRLVGRK